MFKWSSAAPLAFSAMVCRCHGWYALVGKSRQLSFGVLVTPTTAASSAFGGSGCVLTALVLHHASVLGEGKTAELELSCLDILVTITPG